MILPFASQIAATFGFTDLWRLQGDCNKQYTDSNEPKLRHGDLQMDMLLFFLVGACYSIAYSFPSSDLWSDLILLK